MMVTDGSVAIAVLANDCVGVQGDDAGADGRSRSRRAASVTPAAGGTLVYTPNAGFTGSTRSPTRMTDDTGFRRPATVSVKVFPTPSVNASNSLGAGRRRRRLGRHRDRRRSRTRARCRSRSTTRPPTTPRRRARTTPRSRGRSRSTRVTRASTWPSRSSAIRRPSPTRVQRPAVEPGQRDARRRCPTARSRSSTRSAGRRRRGHEASTRGRHAHGAGDGELSGPDWTSRSRSTTRRRTARRRPARITWPRPASLTFAPGVLSQDIPITVIGDTIGEADGRVLHRSEQQHGTAWSASRA